MNELTKIKNLLKKLLYLTIFLLVSIVVLTVAIFRNGNSELNASIELAEKINDGLKENYDQTKNVITALEDLQTYVYDSQFEIQMLDSAVNYMKGSIKRQLYFQNRELVSLIEEFQNSKAEDDSLKFRAMYFPTLN